MEGLCIMQAGAEGGKESAAVGREKKKRTKKTSARKKCGKKSSSDVPLATATPASRPLTLQEVFRFSFFSRLLDEVKFAHYSQIFRKAQNGTERKWDSLKTINPMRPFCF